MAHQGRIGLAATDRVGAASMALRIGIITGVGMAGTLDEVTFHQLLQWHTFYVHTTATWRIVSDGLFHLFSSAMLVLGTILLWRNRRLLGQPGLGRFLIAGHLIGAGGFNLYDGTIQHKILQLHPVREGVDNILIYDLAWNGGALLLLLAGWLLYRRARHQWDQRAA
jgi:uncharacterized membrane protein